jgi:hypothetical protein
MVAPVVVLRVLQGRQVVLAVLDKEVPRAPVERAVRQELVVPLVLPAHHKAEETELRQLRVIRQRRAQAALAPVVTEVHSLRLVLLAAAAAADIMVAAVAVLRALTPELVVVVVVVAPTLIQLV